MMKKAVIINISVLLIVLYLLSACQSRLVKRRDKQAEVDSSLYFEPVKKIEDPFFNTVAEHETQSITLTKTVIPPEDVAEKEKWKEIEGFRVQIFAALDSIHALNTLYNCKPLVKDTLYLIYEKGLYKVQVGDYPFRPQADSANTFLKNNGYPGAWVVRRNIFIPVVNSSDIAVKHDEKIEEKKLTATGKYRIQLIVTSLEEKARLIAAEMRHSKNYNTTYIKVGEVFKVFIGPFQDETEARAVLQEVKKSGYPDAWLIY
jgi:hypothetical protein